MNVVRLIVAFLATYLLMILGVIATAFVAWAAFVPSILGFGIVTMTAVINTVVLSILAGAILKLIAEFTAIKILGNAWNLQKWHYNQNGRYYEAA